MVIEIDGLIHQLPENEEADANRTAWLNKQGFKVIRFSNDEVLNNTGKVIEEISLILKAQPSIKEPIPQTNFSVQGFTEAPSRKEGEQTPSILKEDTKDKETNNLVPLRGTGADYMGAFAVCIQGAREHIDRFAADHDDYNKILVQILADRFVEAFAECLHQQVRKQYWGYANDETLSNEKLIREEYKGIRPAPGYPSCPDHTEKLKLFSLLNVTENIGIELTESLAMNPPASVCGWYFAHPDSHYFGLGKIGRDQLEDYAKRKNMPLEEMEKWLRPALDS
ncbi:MAG: vitamin B12 dependent-methionine synthase activation domain-containing protein [Chitinophagaceae bacterium]